MRFNFPHKKYPELVNNIFGACEETTTGIVRLRAMQKDKALRFPVIAVNNAYSKYLFDNYGTGQVIEGILSATNMIAWQKRHRCWIWLVR